MIAEVDAECDQLFRISNMAHGFDGANPHVDLVEEFERDRGLYRHGRHVAILVGSSRVRCPRRGDHNSSVTQRLTGLGQMARQCAHVARRSYSHRAD
jgi:hypothetical protein